MCTQLVALAPPPSPLPTRNYFSAPPAPQLRPAARLPGAGHTLSPLGTPPLGARRWPAPRPARHVTTPPSTRVRIGNPDLGGWDPSCSTAPQRDCSFQTSTVGSGHSLRCGRWEPPHRRPGHNCWLLSRTVKVGPATLGATRRLTGLQLANASCRGHRRGAGREPPWRGQPRENLLRPER